MLETSEPGAPTLSHLLSRAGDGPGIVFFDAVLGYDVVDRRATALAAGLRDRGLRPGDRVGLILQNDPQFVLALFAVWRAGGVVVPINPMLREREVGELLADAGARSVIVLDELVPVVRASGAPLDLLVSTWAGAHAATPSAVLGPEAGVPEGAIDLGELEAVDPTFVPLEPEPDDLAVLAYTSGTTGPPKGAMISHGNLAVSADRWSTWVGLAPGDVMLGLSPLFHVSGLVGHVAASVAARIPLVLTHRFDASTALTLCERWGATCTAAPITAYLALLEAGRRDGTLGSLRTLTKAVSGGAAVPAAVASRFADATGVLIHQGYGLTETTALVAGTPIGALGPVDVTSGALAVGRVVPGTEVAVVDGTGQPLPAGEPGEVRVRGAQVVAGYWGRETETAAVLRDGWLRTGDVGVLDEDGWLYIVDRLKDLIVASGYKVWPGEVEQALHRHPGVLEVAVVGAPDAYRGETVVAHVALRPGSAARELDLIAHCRVELAAYKCPTRIVLHPELPKSATGKVLRRLLRDVEHEPVASIAGAPRPRSPEGAGVPAS